MRLHHKNGFLFKAIKTVLTVVAFQALIGCDESLPLPITHQTVCNDATVLREPEGEYSYHTAKRIAFKPATLSGVQWAPAESIQAFFGTRKVRLVIAQSANLYLVSWETGNPSVYQLNQSDETPDSTAPISFSSPLFSPDGNWIVFAADFGAQGFALSVKNPAGSNWRIPLSVDGYLTADPHWVVRDGKTWVYSASAGSENPEGPVEYEDACRQFEGSTYREQLLNDSTFDTLRTSGLPGAFRGGFSKDGVWAGTAYSPAGLYNTTTPSIDPILLAGRHQKCNPSMNPFASGSANADFFMLLGFGGAEDYHTATGVLRENEHGNLWIHDRGDTIIWQGKLPDSSRYELWDKPEWSTHPLFATAVAARNGEQDGALNCDLYSVKLPDLAQGRRDTLYQAAGYLKLGAGSFGQSTYTHLWVGP